VLGWLRRQPAVAGALLGEDGKTLDVRFRDGQQAAILPRSLGTATLTPDGLRLLNRPLARSDAPGGKALVLEPFAAELGLGPNAADPEITQLKNAGFSVDSLYDTNVTVATMGLMPRYNVVYMHTHSGTNAGGEGVLATGELTNDDAALASLLQDGSVIKVGVSGTKDTYYGITSAYIRNHESSFATNSLLFLNGCNLLLAPVFWQALQAKGAGVLVSWDKEATSRDNYLGAAAFFAELVQGMSVSAAIQAEQAAGYGTSDVQGTTAKMGFLGNGNLTLQQAANGQPGAPSATATPVPTARAAGPTATAVPVPTATQVPITLPHLNIQLTHRVTPGAKQVIRVNAPAGTTVRVLVSFPTGDSLSGTATADSSGVARYTFVQPSSRITYKHVFARVTVEASNGPALSSLTTWYRINFGHLDLSVQPRKQKVHGTVMLWAHAKHHSTVRFTVRYPNGETQTLKPAITGPHGWVHARYKVQQYFAKPVTVRARVRIGGKRYTASTSFTVTE
jgi:hypothetical protein